MGEKAVVLWSGGKDCNLSLHIAKQKGYDVLALVTFYSSSTEFRAHAKELMDLQSKSLGIPHMLLQVEEPFAENYEVQLTKLKNQLGIEVVISGDISEVHGNSNWISDRAAAVNLQTFLPLWHADRVDVMKQLLNSNFEVVLSMVKEPWFDTSFLGRKITPELIDEFQRLGKENGLDLCGEQGEYHTMVLNGPGYRSPITIEKFSTEKHNEMFHFTDLQISLNANYDVPQLEKHKICVSCGIPFSCYTSGCWCADLPMIMPMENITDCLCPNCLKAEINRKLEENNLNTI